MNLAQRIDRNVILRYAPNLQIGLNTQSITLRLINNALELPIEALLVLEAFKLPTSFDDGMSRTAKTVSARNEWMRLMDIALSMVEFGALVDVSQTIPYTHQNSIIPSVSLHLMLLDDEVRTTLYLEALRQTIRPTDVVLDIGTGSGVLAAGAALAGAKHVYAIEGDPIAKGARSVIEHNGLAEHVTVIENWSTQIELPERADVLVSEIIGSGVFGEDVLRVTHDAAQRLLKPDARMIPYRVRMYAILIQEDDAQFDSQVRDTEHMMRWKELYGIDFSPLLPLRQPERLAAFHEPEKIHQFKFLSDPTLLLDLDLTNIQAFSVEATVTVTVIEAGTVQGALIFFEANLTAEIILSTHPTASTRPKAWSNHVWYCTATPAKTGSTFAIHLSHKERFPLTYDIQLEPMTDSTS